MILESCYFGGKTDPEEILAKLRPEEVERGKRAADLVLEKIQDRPMARATPTD